MKKKGFTLVELLVVIAIIALLMSVLMPALGKARELARSIVCTSNVHQLSIAWVSYSNDNNGKLVGGHCGEKYNANPNWDRESGEVYDWVEPPQRIHPRTGRAVYPSNATVEDEITGIKEANFFNYTRNIDLYHCPSDKRFEREGKYVARYRSYTVFGSMNGDVINNGTSWLLKESGFGERANTQYSQISNPSQKAVFMEEKTSSGNSNWGSWNITHEDYPGYERRWWDPIVIRHTKCTVFGFADGSCNKHYWRQQSTFDMAEKPYPQCVGQTLYPDEDTEDIDWVRRAFAP